jgi:ribosomal protein S18 acetylase RimI-like enzyme
MANLSGASARAAEHTSHRVLPLRDSQIAVVARILASAFDIDPAYQYLFPHPVSRLRGLADYFSRTLRLNAADGCNYVVVDPAGAVRGSVTLRSPLGSSVSTRTLLLHGLLPFALSSGVDAVRRLLWLKQAYEALEIEAAQGRPHRLIRMLAIAPRDRGQGLGAQLLSHVLDAASADSYLPCVLTTHFERNVIFYRRAGFEVIEQRTLRPPRSAPYNVWSMQRAAAPQRG